MAGAAAITIAFGRQFRYERGFSAQGPIGFLVAGGKFRGQGAE